MGCGLSTQATTPSKSQKSNAGAASKGASSNQKKAPAGGGSFKDNYSVGRTLGEGAFSVVKEVTSRSKRSNYAAKIVTKAKLTKEDEIALHDEIGILKKMKHNHIINLYDVFDEPSYYYLVTELMLGGELFDRIVTKTFYTEKEARDVCKILFDALGYCHSHAIAHRDLKPENLLLMSRNDDKNIKIADFGFAKKVSSSKCLLTQCGTPGYVAPEILHGVPYGVKADMWSLGVITYILLGGYPPFIEQNQRELFKKIKRGQYEFHVEYWGQISKEAKDLIAGLLTVDPDRRMSAEKALENPWITGSDEMLDGKDLGVNLEQFRRYNAKRKVRQAVLTLMATNKLTSLGYMFRTNNSNGR
ncbi:myosin light chain kinase [Chaetoceros tenuissimus]|uniref:non-specific serine/threonine protein kinase n=1 Tax=Chaetoceros tenuissimus TaxID=426638 RepID=A0AAD3CIK1_9STRA|nr:myosin light chain kinase [Chaetoceros tenuissimus]